jgi:AcrR family transcriptional regulator
MSSASSRRARKAQESRVRIIECAGALFASRGHEETTMSDIGECADVSRATVFNYFPRKEDIVIGWFDSQRGVLAGVMAHDKSQRLDTSGRLRRAFRALAGIFEDNPKVGRGMVRAWLHAGGPMLTPESDTTRLFAEEVRAGRERGEVAGDADPDRVGHLLFDAYLGVLYRWVTTPRLDLEKELLAVLETVLRGIAAPAAARRQSSRRSSSADSA